MSGYNATGHKTFVASETMGQYLRAVLATDGTISTAGLTDQDVGVVTRAVLAANDPVDVQLVSAPGTQYMVASKSFNAGVKVYGAAAGKISDVQGTGAFLRGVAMEAAGADGDIIEVMPIVGDTAG